jgi:putative two-component system response regulator
MTQKHQILVTNDDPSSLLILKRSLESAGYEVLAVEDGQDVTEVAVRAQPDLILLNVTLGDDEGLEACRALRRQESTSTVPIVFVITSADTEQVLKVFSAGGSDYVTKPFVVPELLARLKAQINADKAKRTLHNKDDQLQELRRELDNLRRLDPMTNLLNRRSWDEAAEQEHQRYQRHGHPYAVIMIDIDQFKAYNAAYGHQAGDECIRQVAESIASTCRTVDFISRYGGEEFVILAPETDIEKAKKLADRIRRTVWALAITQAPNVETVRITVSLGIAVVEAEQTWEHVFQRADEALHIAKRAGRNMVYAIHGDAKKEIKDSIKESTTQVPNIPPEDNRIDVLVVDDEQTNRIICRGSLEKEGYHVREAVDGHDALTKTEEKHPDVIIMDVMMPNMDGLECTRTLRNNPDTQDIPIIIVSALSRTEDILAGLEAGADEYLSKPFRSSELVLRVQSMARLHRERMDLLLSYEHRGKQMKILSRLVEFCRSVSNSKSPHEILEYTVGAVADVTDCQRVSIMLPDPNEHYLTIVSSIGVDKELTHSVQVPLGEPISGQVYTTGRATVVNNETEAKHRFEDYDAPFFASIPLVSAPLDASGKVVGVLNTTEKRNGAPFETRDLEYIELISKVAGTAIHDLDMQEARNQASDSIMLGLAKLAEYRDNDTGRHLDRVTKFCLMLAETLREKDKFKAKIDDDFLSRLERSVPLHDIGKVAIPDEILLFPGKLNEEQRTIMQMHTIAGANTIQSLMEKAPGVDFLRMAMQIARCHHERFDGNGYPDGLRGEHIPLAARIVSVADVYDALTTKRVYKEAFSHGKSMTIILEGSGSQFDPEIVDAFLQREQDFAELARKLRDDQPVCNEVPKEIAAITGCANGVKTTI